tara:strand:- start:1709 stop:1864 length:156 start_codon:yes stop_codon:yes gene_type:complete
MNRQEVYCDCCGGEFIIETPSLLPVSFCPNCGAEVEPEKSPDDQWEEEGWE